MSLLEKLFPNLTSRHGIPFWPNLDRPWSVFDDTEKDNLISQIIKISGDDRVFIHPSAKIGDFVSIEGPSYIGKNVEVRNSAFIRKGTWLCEGSLVGHSSEIKNSILLPGAKAPHFNYVGDSIMGHEVNLGAGTKLSNVRNDRRVVLVTIDDGTRLDTGLRKLGAIIGDCSQLGCNVVTNPGSILMPDSMIKPNVTISGWNETRS